MKNQNIIYTMRGRVVWISDHLFHIPVIDDLYRVHHVQNLGEVDLDNCTNYVVEYFHKFSDNNLLAALNNNDDADEIKLAHEKIKVFIRLSEFVNYSYQAALPLVFSFEEDKIEMLAEGLIAKDSMIPEAFERHHLFIEKLIHDKKSELKNRYLTLVHQLKNATSFEEVRDVGYKVVFEGINVV